MIIDQNKLDFICEILANEFNSDDVRLTVSDTLYHLSFRTASKNNIPAWNWSISIRRNDNTIFRISSSGIFEATLSEFSRSKPLILLESTLKQFIEIKHQQSDEEFMEYFPDFKNRLRDIKIDKLNN